MNNKPNNVNDNGNFQRKSSMINDNDRETKKRRISADEVDRIADNICEKMGSRNEIARMLYCKAAWNLPQSKIWQCVEIAKEKGRNPLKYLSFLLKDELNKTA